MIQNKTTLDDQSILEIAEMFGGGSRLARFTITDDMLLKNLGVFYPIKDLIKKIGLKYYVYFWKRKLYLLQEYFKIIEEKEKQIGMCNEKS